ncbi:SGNH/GDSL hydrolase family protein [Skermania sp. ID1734]|uniref:SGNH/GDSL hydrolase family protein n=1 Tax=Skermania sp. ID1734 TaxID=2597516 RepID=UPI002107B9A1|nr:SGNH/GDSL hydrolase family protein [Skermania sp. ID1734]
MVGLGDSVAAATNCPGCRSFVALFAGALSAKYRTVVRESDLGVDGATTADLLDSLNRPGRVAAETAAADFVTVTIGANDVAGLNDTLARGGCPQGSCVDAATLSGIRDRLDEVLTRIAALRGGRRSDVFVTGYWNDYPDGQVAVQQSGRLFVMQSAAVTREVNAVIAQAASDTGAVYVDLVSAFKGIDSSRDPTGLLAGDGDHPNQAGHRAIARQLAAAEDDSAAG